MKTKRITKRVSVTLTGTKEEIFKTQILLRMFTDFMRLGLNGQVAMKQTVMLTEPIEFKSLTKKSVK